MKRLFSIVYLISILIVLSGCSLIDKQSTIEPTPDLQETIRWVVDDAVMAASTQIMYEVQQQIATLQPGTAEVPSEVPPVEAGKATATSIWQGIHDYTGYEITPTPRNCINSVKFVQDITIPDGTVVLRGKPFTKTWRLRNVGTCEWTDQYSLVFSDGDRMSARERITLQQGIVIKPDDTIEISVYMNAPEKPGTYAGYWMIESETGELFGTGDNNDKAIWVKVEVK